MSKNRAIARCQLHGYTCNCPQRIAEQFQSDHPLSIRMERKAAALDMLANFHPPIIITLINEPGKPLVWKVENGRRVYATESTLLLAVEKLYYQRTLE